MPTRLALTTLTRAATAFRSGDELLEAIRTNGYVPTLSRVVPAQRALADRLVELGHRVYAVGGGKPAAFIGPARREHDCAVTVDAPANPEALRQAALLSGLKTSMAVMAGAIWGLPLS